MRSTSKFVLSAAVATTVASLFPAAARATTVTWTGAVADPNSATYDVTPAGTAAGFVDNQNLYLWNASVANWSGAPTYTVGDDVIFTDNFAGGTDIRMPSSNMNPTSISFNHIAGTSPVTYRFTHNSGTLNNTDFWSDGTHLTNLSANTPFGANSSTTLTLNTGFLGTVVLRHRSNSATTFGNTIIKSGILEISDGGALPHTNNQNAPNLTLDGGEFRVKVNTLGNANPAGGQLAGTLTVLSNSTLSNGETTRTPANQGSTMWNGPVSMGAGITLTLKSYTNVRANLSNMNISNVAGTILLADDDGISYGTDGVANVTVVGVNNQTSHDATNALIDLGSGSSEIVNTGGNLTYDWGALQGGANTKIGGSPTTAGTGTFSIGARGDSTTFAGIFRDDPVFTTGFVALTKVGSGTLTLTGASTHTGATTATAVGGAGTLLLSGANGSVVNSPVTINQAGTLSVNNTTSNSNRLSNTLALTMNQGTLNFQGNLGGTPTAEVVGALTIAGGSNVVQTTATGAGGPASLTFASLARTSGVVDFQPNANVNIALTSSSPVNGILGGYATVNQNDWAGLSGSNIVVYSGYTTNTAPGTWAGAQNINLTTGGTSTVAPSANINSLRFAGTGTAVSISAGQTLNIGTGGVLATGTGGASISGAGTLTAGAGVAELIVTVPTVGNTLTISAPIADNGGGAVTFVKTGAGKLILNGSGSTYTGGTQITGGALQVGVANFFPAGSNLTINYGTSFDIGGFNQSFGTVALIDGSLQNSGGAASVSATTLYDVRNGTVSAALGGAAPLTKISAATVTLTGANTYSGGTTVTGGTLAAGATNTLPAAQAVSVSGGATLNVGAFNQSIGTLTIGNLTTSSGNITGTSGVITASSIDAQNGTVSAILGGTTGLTKAGSNTTVTLNGLNTYTGPTVVVGSANSGTLAINTLANGGAASSVGASSSAASNLVLGGPLLLSYTGTGSSTDRLFNMTGITLSIGSNGTGPVNFTNTGAIGGASGGTFTLTGSNTGANTFAPLLDSTNVAALSKGGNGTWILTNNNTYTGVTTVGGAGVLSVPVLANGGVASPIGASSNAAASLVLNGGTLRYTGTGHTTDRLFTMNNNGALDASGTGAVNFNNTGATAVATAGPRTLTLTGSNTGNNTLAGSLSNPAGSTLAVNKTGAGRWQLSNLSNNYTGGTTVSAGTLAVGRMHESNAVSITGGKLEVLESVPGLSSGFPSGNNASVSRPTSLTIANNGAALGIRVYNGTVDLTNNDLILDYTAGSSPILNIEDMVRAGFNEGDWLGIGITSSTAAADSNFAVGVADNATLATPFGTAQGGPLFAGIDVDADTVLVKFTHRVDLDLDGKITPNDASIFGTNYSLGDPAFWAIGDLDYDGKYTPNDASIFGTFYDTSVASLPEPGTLGVLGLGVLAIGFRRVRRGSRGAIKSLNNYPLTAETRSK